MQVLAEAAHHLQASVPVLVEKHKQIFSLDFCHLRIFQQLRGHLMRAAYQGSAQTKNFSRAGQPECQLAPGFRTYRKLRAPLAEHKNTSGRLTLAEQYRATRMEAQRLQFIKVTEGVRGEAAEQTVGTSNAIQAAAIGYALHAL